MALMASTPLIPGNRGSIDKKARLVAERHFHRLHPAEKSGGLPPPPSFPGMIGVNP
jgi:hypothetical protein